MAEGNPEQICTGQGGEARRIDPTNEADEW